jgi:ectoine hydrolase
MSVFSSAEYARRLALVQQRMGVAALDALLVIDPADMNWLSGYDGWSFYVPQAVLVLAGDPVPFWLGRGIDRSGAALTCWMPDDRLLAYDDSFVENPPRHAMEFMAARLTDLGVGHRRIGVPMDGCYFSARAHAVLAAALPGVLVDADGLVAWTRIVKSNAELALMREAASIADAAMLEAAAAIQPGVQECDAAARIVARQVVGVDELAGAYPAEWVTMPSGKRAQAAHLTWADRRYEAGDSVNVELAGCRHRYHAGLSRTVVVDRADASLQSLADATAEGMAAALQIAIAGTTCEAVEAAFRDAVGRHGYAKPSRIGYTLGIGYPPTWGERTASLRPGDITVLLPGMAFHLMLGMWGERASCVLSEVFVVRETGPPETFSTLPRTLLGGA